jgi:hypothetical protein
MSGRLSNLNDLEHKLFKKYVDIIEGEEPEYIKTAEGVFDNREWLEKETEYLLEERERLEETTNLNGETIDID